MDYSALVQDLKSQLARVEESIARLEQLRDSVEPRRRGRVSMDAAERLQVSARMKAYWAARRRAEFAGQPEKMQ